MRDVLKILAIVLAFLLMLPGACFMFVGISAGILEFFGVGCVILLAIILLFIAGRSDKGR